MPDTATFLLAIAAIVAALVIPAIGYLLKRFVADAIVSFRVVCRNVDRAEAYYDDVLGNAAMPDEAIPLSVKRKQAGRVLRGLATELRATYGAIRCRRALAAAGIVPRPGSVDAAAGALFALSNSTHPRPDTEDIRANDEWREVLRMSLGLGPRPLHLHVKQ